MDARREERLAQAAREYSVEASGKPETSPTVEAPSKESLYELLGKPVLTNMGRGVLWKVLPSSDSLGVVLGAAPERRGFHVPGRADVETPDGVGVILSRVLV
jgi:hypothetical protein